MILHGARCHSKPVCLVGIFWLFPYVCAARANQKEERRGGVEGENKVCGRNYPRFWQGLLSTPICESRLRSPAKHNISSILSQRQANIIEQRLFFPLTLTPWDLPCWGEWLKPTAIRSEKRKGVRKTRQHSSRGGKERRGLNSLFRRHTTFGLNSICVLNTSKVWATGGEREQHCTIRTVVILCRQ